MGAIEGALGDLETAAAEGHLDATASTRLLDRVTGAARQLAVDAIKEATARGDKQAGICRGQPGRPRVRRPTLESGELRLTPLSVVVSVSVRYH
jgi:hypothetical protein